MDVATLRPAVELPRFTSNGEDHELSLPIEDRRAWSSAARRPVGSGAACRRRSDFPALARGRARIGSASSRCSAGAAAARAATAFAACVATACVAAALAGSTRRTRHERGQLVIGAGAPRRRRSRDQHTESQHESCTNRHKTPWKTDRRQRSPSRPRTSIIRDTPSTLLWHRSNRATLQKTRTTSATVTAARPALGQETGITANKSRRSLLLTQQRADNEALSLALHRLAN